jgi:Ca2+-binding RTX toxin-like protein
MAIVTVTGASAEEGSGSSFNYNEPVVSINLSSPATAPVQVGYRLLSGTGQADTDMVGTGSRSVTFQAGEQSKSISLRTIVDNVTEFDEALIFEAFVISGNANFPGDAPVGRATVFVLDDDGQTTPEAIFVSRPVLTEGDGGTQTANFEVSLSRPASSGFSIPWSTQAGSATPGEDFTAASGTLSFVTGQQRATIGVQVLGDETVEPDEQFTIRFTPPGGFGEVSVGAATILDDDTAPNGPSVSAQGGSAFEGSGSSFNYSEPLVAINLSGPATASTQVGYRLVSGTAQVGTDIVNPGSNRSVTFGIGEQSETIRLRTIVDDTAEADEFAILETFIQNTVTNNARIAGNRPVDQAIVWVLDDDGTGQPAIGITSPTVVEGDGGTSSAAVKVSLSRPATESFQINYATQSNGSARAGQDYVATNGTIDVAPGQQEFAFNIPIVGDREQESQESFLLSLSPSVFYAGASVATITILDTDVPPPPPTGGNDFIDFRGYATGQTVNGLGGNDRIFGGLVRDFLNGGAGGDIINGGRGSDIIRGDSGFDVLNGEGGNDVIRGGTDNDRISGGVGDDKLFGDAGFDTIFGGNGEDEIRGGAQADLLSGQNGADDISGGAGNDRIEGGEGSDILSGEDGNDRLFAGAGGDRVSGGAGFDLLSGEAGNDRLFGGAQADNIFGGVGNDRLDGGGGFDRLIGGLGNDVMVGGGGGDALFGEFGNDTLIGNAGNDRLFGGAGFDVLVGGTGNDRLQGDLNADQFVFQNGFGRDTIVGFESRNDFERIDLEDVSSITNFADLSANHLRQQGNNAVIDAGGGNTITLLGVRVADLDPADFTF